MEWDGADSTCFDLPVFFHFRDFDSVLQQNYGLNKIRIMSHLAHYSNFVLSMLL